MTLWGLLLFFTEIKLSACKVTCRDSWLEWREKKIRNAFPFVAQIFNIAFDYKTVHDENSVKVHQIKLALPLQSLFLAVVDPFTRPLTAHTYLSPLPGVLLVHSPVAALFFFPLLLPFSPLFHFLFPGNWVWVLMVGSKGLGWSCWELCTRVCDCVCVCWEVS